MPVGEVMVKVSYVYPNVSGITQRGGLSERWELAKELNCSYIEIPADFIKNKTEMEKTNLDLCDFLDNESIPILYTKDKTIPEDIKYILHSEPSLSRRDGYGLSNQAALKWYNQEWTEKFTKMLVSISKFLGIPPKAIEIHPGDRRNSFGDVSDSIKLLLDIYRRELNVEPLILMENRTGQVISSGEEIQSFWEHLSTENPNLKNKVGIVLDVQQLFTSTKKNFLRELDLIPSEALKGFHIHYKHRVPSSSDEIPWNEVFERIKDPKNDILINPEIHHKNKVSVAIEFCEEMLQD